MATVNLDIQLDSELAQQFGDFCAAVGMDVSTAFSIYAKKVVNTHRIPFEITSDNDDGIMSWLTESDIVYLGRAVKEMDAGGGHYHEITDD